MGKVDHFPIAMSSYQPFARQTHKEKLCCLRKFGWKTSDIRIYLRVEYPISKLQGTSSGDFLPKSGSSGIGAFNRSAKASSSGGGTSRVSRPSDPKGRDSLTTIGPLRMLSAIAARFAALRHQSSEQWQLLGSLINSG